MKARILNILKQQDDVLSGETLSSELGISRVSVWKHIRKLQELGYDIASGPKGYRLSGVPEIPLPWEFPDREDRIHYFPEISSTMDTARDMARKRCPEFTVVIAGRQTKGRGRLQRRWVSDDGGLYFTVVVRPRIHPVLSSRVNFAASLSLACMLREKYGVDAQVKWPNDILVNEKKITGMLSELEADGDQVSFVNIGMGINVNNEPDSEEPNAASLKKILGRTLSRREVLAAFLDEFEQRMAALDYDTVIDEWKRYTLTIGRRVRIVTVREELEGLAVDVAPDGALVLELADGTQKQVIYGDCFLHPPEK